MAIHDYPTRQNAPRGQLQSLLEPPTPVRVRLEALDDAREQRIAHLHRAVSLRWESRGRLARQHLIDGAVDIGAYRQEIAAADRAREVEEADVPPAVDRSALHEHALAVARQAVAGYYDQAIVAVERVYAAWTPAAIEQAEGGHDDGAA